MVSLRDGKTYDAGGLTPSRRRVTRKSTQRESTVTTDSQLFPSRVDDEPQTPTEAQGRGAKRGRPLQHLELETIVDQSPAAADNSSLVQDTLRAAAETQLPSPGYSPLPKKKQRTAAQPERRKQWLTTSLTALAIAALAITVAAAWPHYGLAVRTSVSRAAQAADSYFGGLQLQARLATLEASAAAFTDATVQLLQTHTSDIQQHMNMVLRQLHVKYPTLIPDGWATPGLGAADHRAWAPDALYSILPPGDRWHELSVDITDKLRSPAAQRSYKATAMLLACATAEDCRVAAAALSQLPPHSAKCTLQLDAHALAAGSEQPAAALQAALAPFLKRCPTGLVLLQQAEQLPVAAVPALHNALSELGGFQHGGSVDSSRAAYALLMQMPVQAIFAAAASPDTSKTADIIKEAFFNKQKELLHQQRPQQQDSTAGEAWGVIDRALRTLHRRIDFAAPVKLGKAAEAEMLRLLTVQKSTDFDQMEMESGLAGAAMFEAAEERDAPSIMQE